MEFSKEQLEKAAACKNVEEFQELAKSEGIELSDDEAEAYFAEFNNEHLSDDELDEVAGGVHKPNPSCSCKSKRTYSNK